VRKIRPSKFRVKLDAKFYGFSIRNRGSLRRPYARAPILQAKGAGQMKPDILRDEELPQRLSWTSLVVCIGILVVAFVIHYLAQS
jgi:hypothetical protein